MGMGKKWRYVWLLALLSVLLSGCGREKVSTDLSEIETAFSPVWSVERTERIVRADGRIGSLENDSNWLCRYNFERGEVETIAIPVNCKFLMPSDTPRGIAMILWQDGEVFYVFNDRGEVKSLFFTPGLHICQTLGWYGEKLYYRAYPEEYGGLSPTQVYCPDTGEVHTYLSSDHVLCVLEDGRILIRADRDAGTQVLHRYRDESGELQAVERKVEAWTLGLEDLQGNWTPLMNVGEDCALKRVHSAALAGNDRALLVTDGAEEYALQWLDLATGELQALTDEKGRGIALCVPYDRWWPNSLQLSPDHKYVFYAALEFMEGYGVRESYLAQSLQTGECYRIYQSEETMVGDRLIKEDLVYLRAYWELVFK